MKRLTYFSAIVAMFIGAQNIFAGPEAISPKESKTVVQPVVEKECRWTGFYIGGHGGYAWGGDISFLEEDEFDEPFRFDRESWIGGGQAGFNLQLGAMFVIGVEGTFSAGDFSDSTVIQPTTDTTAGHIDTDWIATVGGRLGVSFWRNHFLFYGKGGVAFTNYDFDTSEVDDNGRFHADDDETMPLIGVGLEYAFNCHWSVRVEYNHFFADDDDEVTGTETDRDGSSSDGFDRTFHVSRGDWDTVTAGINFKF